MSNLFEIVKKYPTTKNKMGYIDIYDSFFNKLKDQQIDILEIGVDDGLSLKLWREYFTKANICGIDIVKKDFKINDVDILCGDQSDHAFLNTVVKKYNKFDIIIDDGSHFSKHIIASFKFLFKYLNNNGLYIIEDLQTSYFPRFGGSRLNLSKKNTSMNFIKKMTDSVNYEHHDRPFYKKTPYDGVIKSVNFYQNIVFIRKGESRKHLYGEANKSFGEYLKKIISYLYK